MNSSVWSSSSAALAVLQFFFHSLAKHIAETCIERGVGRSNVGDLVGVREDENGESKKWGRHGNLDLHGWAFDRFTSILTYKAKVEGIEVVEVSERDTSKTCYVCAGEKTTVSALNVVCTCVRNTTMRSTQT
jgi:IS605 OrfB family transposase